MDTTNLSELEDLIRKSLDEFYKRRINKLSQLKLSLTRRMTEFIVFVPVRLFGKN
jgi:hypothetical protein